VLPLAAPDNIIEACGRPMGVPADIQRLMAKSFKILANYGFTNLD
jgi:hypothetical protein